MSNRSILIRKNLNARSCLGTPLRKRRWRVFMGNFPQQTGTLLTGRERENKLANRCLSLVIRQKGPRLAP
jgi:hypothetical protein